MVTPEAVEAARKVMARGAYQMSNDELPYEHVARAALEAAAPHMLQSAYELGWEDGREGNRDHMPPEPTE